MIGNLEPEENVMSSDGLLEKLSIAIEQLDWEKDANIAVEIGGSSIYGIDGAGTKWAPTKGTRKYNKDAFIVIKNLDLNPVVPSQPNPELKQHHET